MPTFTKPKTTLFSGISGLALPRPPVPLSEDAAVDATGCRQRRVSAEHLKQLGADHGGDDLSEQWLELQAVQEASYCVCTVAQDAAKTALSQSLAHSSRSQAESSARRQSNAAAPHDKVWHPHHRE